MALCLVKLVPSRRLRGTSRLVPEERERVAGIRADHQHPVRQSGAHQALPLVPRPGIGRVGSGCDVVEHDADRFGGAGVSASWATQKPAETVSKADTG